jgi:hypothetical protein
MSYLGNDLTDYYSYELIDKVINQIQNNDTGDVKKLLFNIEKLNKIVEKTIKKGKYVNKRI